MSDDVKLFFNDETRTAFMLALHDVATGLRTQYPDEFRRADQLRATPGRTAPQYDVDETWLDGKWGPR